MGEAVLIVDDSLTVRMDLAEAIGAEGFRAVPCATVAEARLALAREDIRLVILDVLLPDGDGLGLLKEIRDSSTCSSIPVMLLSSEAEVRDRIRGLATGADEYVGKPYETSYVVSRARELAQRCPVECAPQPRTILVIDDSATFRMELRSSLEAAGYKVLLAPSGEEGLRAAADARPHGIIVDDVLPGVDGATVVRRLRLDAALRRIPCLLLTGSGDQSAELRALDSGADGFIRKEEDIAVILARLDAAVRAASSEVPAEVPASLLGPKKILAVDDSLTYLQALSEALRGEGYDVALAHSGQEALDLLAVQQVDCILLDLLMPGLSGHDTCCRIKSAPIVREIPLIMLTALEDRQAMIHGLRAGADDYIAKSSDLEVLKARVRAQIRRKQFEEENRRIRERLLRTEHEAAEARAVRELAEARAALVLELERKNKELEAFSYSVSHDLRAPLRSIDGFSQALLEHYSDGLDEKGRGYLVRVRAATQRMGELIDDLLHLSRVSRAEVHTRRLDLSKLAQSVATELKSKHPDRQVELVIEQGLSSDADAGLMRVVFENLLGNAWKFTEKTPQARIEVGVQHKEWGPAYLVRDNGAGFDMEYAGKLFQPFQRLHAEAEFPGTGIGLATVSRIIDRHGGRVWAEAAVGVGATFYFTLEGARPGGLR